jgi:RES domain-containing protein
MNPVPPAGPWHASTQHGIRTLAGRIAPLPLSRIEGTFCRAVRSRHLDRLPPQPLYYHGSAAAGGRYTPLGGPAALYLANHQYTALVEIRDLLFDSRGELLPIEPLDPATLVTAEVVVHGVLDLTDSAARDALGVTDGGILAPWEPAMEAYLRGAGEMPLTQQIGQAAHLTGRVRGIYYPSARYAGGLCLAVFPDRLSAAEGDRIVVHDSTGRLAQRLP